MQIIIRSEGSVRCLYREELDLHRIGKLAIARASHVEPTSDGQWTADLAPVQGPVLGPFGSRSDALDAERKWLEDHWLMDERRCHRFPQMIARTRNSSAILLPRPLRLPFGNY